VAVHSANSPEALSTCGFATLSYVNLFAKELLYPFEHGILGRIIGVVLRRYFEQGWESLLVFVHSGSNSLRNVLIDEKDGDVLTLSVLAERSFDSLNFSLRFDNKEVLLVLRYLSNPC